jgi:hypothetical protein
LSNLTEQAVKELLEQKSSLNSFPPPKGALGEETKFAPVHVGELLTQTDPKIDWVWEPMIPTGSLFLLIAFMKLGKSELAYRLAVAVAKGMPFLGMATQKTPVLILAVEEHPRDVKMRLLRLKAAASDPIYVHSSSLLNTQDTITALKGFIIEKGIGLVLIDTVSRFWKVQDENDNQEIIREASPLLNIARDTGAAMGLLHHERKSGGEDGRSIRGGSALFGLVDQAIILERRHGGAETHRVLKTIGRYADSPKELAMDLVDGEYRVIGTVEEAGKLAAKKALLDALTPEPMTVEQLAKETSLHKKRTYDILQEAYKEGRVIREGKGARGDPYTYRKPKE